MPLQLFKKDDDKLDDDVKIQNDRLLKRQELLELRGGKSIPELIDIANTTKEKSKK